MTTMTIAPALTGGHDPAYYAGRADAYDEHGDGTTTAELRTRAECIADFHPNKDYALGYAAYAASARLEQDAQQDTRRADITTNNTYWQKAAA
ncbi:hypothetical protein OG473_39500 (plasmid) [Streptomyces anulatus]|uniref:hypothetical protein n=1 Tax=Streptomyces anulatus TaxID=1892 RepID=UPI003255F2B3